MEDQGRLRCPSCGHGNREEARFCDGCGGPLARTCAACGMSLRPAARFCDGCGEPVSRSATAAPPRNVRDYTPSHLVEKILTSRGALEGERKQVTVLFADVKGSMELAEQLDPEVYHRVMERFAQLLAEGVHRFEGTVNQYTGDGIMALFGAPIAHEDHAQRACYAALHLREELSHYAEELKRTKGLGFAVRMGINSGEVVVGTIGDDLRMHYTAQGHTVGLAARMEQLAGADRVYLTEHTAALVLGYVRLRDLGPFTVKGVRDRSGCTSSKARGPCARSSMCPARAGSRASSGGRRRRRRWKPRWHGRRRAMRKSSASSPRRASARAASATSSSSAATRAGSRSTRRTVQRTGRWSRTSGCLSSCAATSGSASRTQRRRRARRSPAGSCCSTPPSPTPSRSSSTSWAFRIPSARSRASTRTSASSASSRP